MRDVLVGLDIGTTRCKAVALSTQGELIGSAAQEYEIISPVPGWAEQNPEKVWLSVLEVLQRLSKQLSGKNILGIGLSVQGEAVFPLDHQDVPLRNAILGMDLRTGPENDVLRADLGESKLFNITGMPIHTVNTLPKLLWIKRHEPHLWKQAARFVLYEDYFALKLTGIPAISHSLASRTQIYDITQGDWSHFILDYLELDEAKLSRLGFSGEPVGPIRDQIRKALGIQSKPVVVLGGHDQACAAFGAGATEPGMGVISTGTAEVVLVVTEKPVLHDKMREANVSCYRHVVPERYLLMTLNHCGGIVLRWIRDNFGKEEVKEAERTGVDAYELLLADLPEEPTGMIVFPFLSGCGSPSPDIDAKGALLGLTLATTKKTYVKAFIEGLCFELKLNLDFLATLGVNITHLKTVGGGAKSSLWNQTKADIIGQAIEVPIFTDVAPIGAALLAGIGVNVYSSFNEAKSVLKQAIKIFVPKEKHVHQYVHFYNIYQNLRPLIIDATKKL